MDTGTDMATPTYGYGDDYQETSYRKRILNFLRRLLTRSGEEQSHRHHHHRKHDRA